MTLAGVVATGDRKSALRPLPAFATTPTTPTTPRRKPMTSSSTPERTKPRPRLPPLNGRTVSKS